MGVTIQFESHRVELAAIYAMEHNPEILEFHDQPPVLTLLYPTPDGRNRRVRHSSDYAVLGQSGAWWGESKLESDFRHPVANSTWCTALRDLGWEG